MGNANPPRNVALPTQLCSMCDSGCRRQAMAMPNAPSGVCAQQADCTSRFVSVAQDALQQPRADAAALLRGMHADQHDMHEWPVCLRTDWNIFSHSPFPIRPGFPTHQAATTRQIWTTSLYSAAAAAAAGADPSCTTPRTFRKSCCLASRYPPYAAASRHFGGGTAASSSRRPCQVLAR
jgi:hypothetical protein